MNKDHFFMVHGDEAVHLHSPSGKPFNVSVDDAGGLRVQDETSGQTINLSEEIAQVKGDGTPHQQLVTDSEGNAKWEDKPFGEKMEEVVVVEKITFTLETAAVRLDVPSREMNVGQVYHVMLDGERYDVEAYGTGTPMISASNGVFELYGSYGGGILHIRTTPAAGPGYLGVEHTIEILTTEESIKTIDPKYLPDIIIPSSTEGSTKRFMLTVDDSGTITATEVT